MLRFWGQDLGILIASLSVFLCVWWVEMEVGMERREEEHLLLTKLGLFCVFFLN